MGEEVNRKRYTSDEMRQIASNMKEENDWWRFIASFNKIGRSNKKCKMNKMAPPSTTNDPCGLKDLKKNDFYDVIASDIFFEVTDLQNPKAVHIRKDSLEESSNILKHEIFTKKLSINKSELKEIESVNHIQVPNEEKVCICHRPATTVKCCECGTEFQGHAERTCNEHPRRINLMDIRECPKCRSRLLEELYS
ncbi:unnamed protein product [Dracunculus medinensis]|uniref:Uncharacterized protein n=1 Tax=Dracunculus medinensis TaxID=318479 RepID=A0A0N4U1P2_DRAME|nr:unnamed protein product [Dracunculus medinensis]